MRAPSLLAQCMPGLLPHDRISHSSLSDADGDLQLSSPAVEILPSKVTYLGKSPIVTLGGHLFLFLGLRYGRLLLGTDLTVNALSYKYARENGYFQGVNIFKGKISVADIISFTNCEPTLSKAEGILKCCEGSIGLLNVLKHEIRDGQLSFRGKRVAELSCGYGFPGILACIKGASVVHFQDLNAEKVRCTTMPNVLANLVQVRDRQSKQSDGSLTPSPQISPDVHFYAGDWEELHTVLSVLQVDNFDMTSSINLSFTEEDFVDECSSRDGSITGHESLKRSRKLSASRAWERANVTDSVEGGYDVILISEIPYSSTSLRKLSALVKKCLRPPYGVLYLTAKRCCVGSNSGARQLRALFDEEGILSGHMLTEIADREYWKFFPK